MSKLKWRKCGVSDTEFIVEEVWREAANGHYNEVLSTEAGKSKFSEQLRDHIQKGNCYDKNFGLMELQGLVAEVDGNKAGYSIFRIDNVKNIAEIWFFGLAEEYQGKGYSRKLLNKTIEKIGGDKTTILARCMSASKPMIHMLKKKGFNIVGEENGTYILCNKQLPFKT